MAFRPLRDFILIKPFKRKDSDILEVVTSKRRYRGEVMAIGKGRYENKDRDMKARPLDVKVGDIVNFGETPVIFPEYLGEDGQKYLIIQEGDIAFEELT